MEKYVAGRITFFLEGKNYFTEKQFGFRNSRSTSGALSTILDNILYQLNNAEFSVVAYLDFQKAFDTINHKIIITKLENAGLGQNSLKLLQNYLSNRKQKTKIHSGISSIKSITVGVPQGSTIRPLMFIVYINDLSKVLQSCKSCMYADDTVLYCGSVNRKLV